MTHQPIPFLDLVTSHRELEEELVAAFRTAVRSARFIGGPEVEGFERATGFYLNPTSPEEAAQVLRDIRL